MPNTHTHEQLAEAAEYADACYERIVVPVFGNDHGSRLCAQLNSLIVRNALNRSLKAARHLNNCPYPVYAERVYYVALSVRRTRVIRTDIGNPLVHEAVRKEGFQRLTAHRHLDTPIPSNTILELRPSILLLEQATNLLGDAALIGITLANRNRLHIAVLSAVEPVAHLIRTGVVTLLPRRTIPDFQTVQAGCWDALLLEELERIRRAAMRATAL